MKKKILKYFTIGLVSVCAPEMYAQDTGPDLGVSPYLYHEPCSMIVDPRGFEIYSDKACDVFFLGPKAIEETQNNISLEGTVALCDGDKSLQESLSDRTAIIGLMSKKAMDAANAGDEIKAEKYLEKADLMQKQLLKSQTDYAEFSSIHASTIQSLFNNSVSGQDIYDFLAQNMFVFFSAKKTPNVMKLPTENSIFSFTHHRPENVGKSALSIISTTIPGLEVLVQSKGAQTDVAHVKAGDVLSGETRLSLMSTCSMLEKKGDKWVLKNDPVRNVMTVNRKYETSMKVGYGIQANLSTDVVTKAVSDILVNAIDNGLTKTQVYNKTVDITGGDAFRVVIDGEIALSDEQREALLLDVRKRLLDRFFHHFEMSGDLVSLEPVELPMPTGGDVLVDQIGTKCWNKSFLGFLKKGGCYDYVYSVKKWKPGLTDSDYKDTFTTKIDISESLTINDVVKVPMTTTFVSEGMIK